MQRINKFWKSTINFCAVAISIKTYYRLSLLLIIALIVDRFLPLNEDEKIGPSAVCGWDYEASWKIGIARGSSPTTLTFGPNEHEVNPIVSCMKVTSVNTSFVADPFLFIPGSQHARGGGADVWRRERPADADKWYLFYEQKNIQRTFQDNRGIGEIGVSVSTDRGRTWTHIGIPLMLRIHLSYPFVMFHEPSQQYVMIPETHQHLTVELYTTSVAEFPFGWKRYKTVLRGFHYVDTSAVFYQGRWWIFLSEEYSLYLYSTNDVLDEDWVEHPMSPVISRDRQYGRSGGPAIVKDGVLYRFAQNCKNFYGEEVAIFRITRLDATHYEEELESVMKPTKTSRWNGERLHHIDAHPDESEHGKPGSWIAVVDGDNNPDDHQKNIRTGAREERKKLLLVALCTALAAVHTMRLRASPYIQL